MDNTQKGGIMYMSSECETYFDSVTFTNIKGGTQGGAFYIQTDSYAEIKNCEFSQVTGTTSAI